MRGFPAAYNVFACVFVVCALASYGSAAVSVTLNLPQNGSNVTSNPVSFGFQASSDSQLSNATLYLNVSRGSQPEPAAATFISNHSTWKYNDSNMYAGEGWYLPGFDDSYWKSGEDYLATNGETAGEGRTTVLNMGSYAYATYYFRKTFTVTNASLVHNLTLGLDYDDSYAIWLNGNPVASVGWGCNWSNHSSTCGSVHNSLIDPSGASTPYYPTINVNSSLIANLSAGDNLMAVAIKQTASTSSDAAFRMELYGWENRTQYFNMSWHANQTLNISGATNTSLFQASLPDGARVWWNVKAHDSSGQMSFAGDNYTFILNTSLSDDPPSATLVFPGNNTTLNYTSVAFNCSAQDDVQLANITLYGGWGGGWHANATANVAGTSNSTTFPVTLPNNSVNTWGCRACDSIGQCGYAPSNNTLTINTAYAPSVLLPTWYGAHMIHTTLSDGSMSQDQRVQALKSLFDAAATADHDTSLTQAEWTASISEADLNNTDGNFTYFWGTEWTSSRHIHYISLNPSATQKDAGDADFNTVGKLVDWLAANSGLGQYNHPARSGQLHNFSDSTKYNETWIPLVEIINQQGGTPYWHWNYWWNCSAGSGCTTYQNPKGSGLQGESSDGWIKHAFDRGIHLGFTVGSDYHGALPYSPQAFTGLVNPPNWTRAGVYDTLKRRHTWAASAKIRMMVTSKDGQDEWVMGDMFNYSSLSFVVNYTINGTSGHSVKNISLFYDGVITNLTYASQQDISGAFTAPLSNGSEHYVFIEAVQDDGHRAWSSPMFVNYVETTTTTSTTLAGGGGGGGRRRTTTTSRQTTTTTLMPATTLGYPSTTALQSSTSTTSPSATPQSNEPRGYLTTTTARQKSTTTASVAAAADETGVLDAKSRGPSQTPTTTVLTWENRLLSGGLGVVAAGGAILLGLLLLLLGAAVVTRHLLLKRRRPKGGISAL